MAPISVGIQLHPQATTLDELRAAARAADEMGADSIWVWDHFYPLYGDPDAAHFERDYDEYGYEFGSAIGRLRALERDLPVIKDRLAKLTPGPVGPLPIMIGGSGRKVTLRIVAEQASAWNTFGSPEEFAETNGVLDDWCAEVGRDPSEIERTVAVDPKAAGQVNEYADAGADHLILMQGPPFPLDALQTALDARG